MQGRQPCSVCTSKEATNHTSDVKWDLSPQPVDLYILNLGDVPGNNTKGERPMVIGLRRPHRPAARAGGPQVPMNVADAVALEQCAEFLQRFLAGGEDPWWPKRTIGILNIDRQVEKVGQYNRECGGRTGAIGVR